MNQITRYYQIVLVTIISIVLFIGCNRNDAHEAVDTVADTANDAIDATVETSKDTVKKAANIDFGVVLEGGFLQKELFLFFRKVCSGTAYAYTLS